jgi:hypothetical protein
VAKLPHDVRVALVSARSSYTPSAARIARLHARIQQAVLDGTQPNVSSDVVSARRFVGIEQARPWPLRVDGTFFGVVALSVIVMLGFLVFSRLRTTTERAPAFIHTASTKRELRQASATNEPGTSIAPASLRPPERAMPSRREATADAPGPPGLDVPAPRMEITSGVPALDPVPSKPDSAGKDRKALPHRVSQSSSGTGTVRLTGSRGPARGAATEPSPNRATSGDSSARLTDDLLVQEVQLLAEARTSLAANQVSRAEEALRRHRGAFPAGQLVSERIALEVRARCLAHDSAGARRLFDELLLRAPKSSLTRGVERDCGELLVP